MSNEQSAAVPPWLADRLRDHRDLHGPHYQGFLSDHLPMALLAMKALGAARRSLDVYAANYEDRLDPPVRHTREPPDSLAEALGQPAAYGALLTYFDREIARHGVAKTLATCLPDLVSGWVRFAFHPIIRLAYGVRFGVEPEVAAGLAYLACAGPDDALQALARGARRQDEITLPDAVPIDAEAPFEHRYNAALASGALSSCVVVLPDNQRALAELALALFNDTHDFFALHVVTGTHALGVCADAIGLDVDGFMSAGLLAAYLAIGAPSFDHEARPTPARIDDEHDAKMAFTCLDQARRLRSRRFDEAASIYAG